MWVICEVVDLGYTMVKGYRSEQRARIEFDRLYAEAVKHRTEMLMRLPGYTAEQAAKFCSTITFYELEYLEVEE
jgi:hypothetical protein